jgi:putative transposase
VPFLAFPPDVRRVVYTTRSRRSTARSADHQDTRQLPDQDAARRPLYLAIVNAQKTWRSAYNWSSALAAFRIHFGDRLPDTAI